MQEHLAQYGQDAQRGCPGRLEHEPPAPGHPFNDVDNIIITPHVGSRTFESVERQALMSTENLLRVLAGQSPLAQANADVWLGFEKEQVEGFFWEAGLTGHGYEPLGMQ